MKYRQPSLVAYSPSGRGFLTGAISSPDDFAEDLQRINKIAPHDVEGTRYPQAIFINNTFY